MTVQEVFNKYRNSDIKEIEKRALEIEEEIESPDSNIKDLKVELEGLNQAKLNILERGANMKYITGMNQPTEIKDHELFESKEYRNAFFKTMLGQKLDQEENKIFTRAMELQQIEKRADAFNTTTDSAAVLPTTTLNEVIAKARTIGGLLSHCRNFNLPTNISVPIGTPATKASWHTEGAAVTTSETTTTAVTFGAYEIIKIFSISAAAKKMSIDAFESYIVTELTNCVMECIADSIVNGTGTTQGTGILNGITWDTSNSFTYTTSVAYSDFTKALGMLKRGYAAKAKFAMSNATLYNSVYNVADANGNPIFLQDPQFDKVGYILGKEIIIDDNIADGTILLGNFDYMGYNIPNGLMLEVSRESSFKSGLIDYRALAIADTKPLVGEAFIKITAAE